MSSDSAQEEELWQAPGLPFGTPVGAGPPEAQGNSGATRTEASLHTQTRWGRADGDHGAEKQGRSCLQRAPGHSSLHRGRTVCLDA